MKRIEYKGSLRQMQDYYNITPKQCHRPEKVFFSKNTTHYYKKITFGLVKIRWLLRLN